MFLTFKKGSLETVISVSNTLIALFRVYSQQQHTGSETLPHACCDNLEFVEINQVIIAGKNWQRAFVADFRTGGSL